MFEPASLSLKRSICSGDMIPPRRCFCRSHLGNRHFQNSKAPKVFSGEHRHKSIYLLLARGINREGRILCAGWCLIKGPATTPQGAADDIKNVSMFVKVHMSSCLQNAVTLRWRDGSVLCPWSAGIITNQYPAALISAHNESGPTASVEVSSPLLRGNNSDAIDHTHKAAWWGL